MTIVSAAALGLSGQETPQTLAANIDLMKTLEHMRVKAGAMMGMGDVTTKVANCLGQLAISCLNLILLIIACLLACVENRFHQSCVLCLLRSLQTL
jgi:hypothetical protein